MLTLADSLQDNEHLIIVEFGKRIDKSIPFGAFKWSQWFHFS